MIKILSGLDEIANDRRTFDRKGLALQGFSVFDKLKLRKARRKKFRQPKRGRGVSFVQRNFAQSLEYPTKIDLTKNPTRPRTRGTAQALPLPMHFCFGGGMH